uniref:Trithorax group protein osa n=1 Tax=Rhabditophanes sp. KR3021 TaxID=114890 RepID=A0AC35THQ4_9BILA
MVCSNSAVQKVDQQYGVDFNKTGDDVWAQVNSGQPIGSYYSYSQVPSQQGRVYQVVYPFVQQSTASQACNVEGGKYALSTRPQYFQIVPQNYQQIGMPQNYQQMMGSQYKKQLTVSQNNRQSSVSQYTQEVQQNYRQSVSPQSNPRSQQNERQSVSFQYYQGPLQNVGQTASPQSSQGLQQNARQSASPPNYEWPQHNLRCSVSPQYYHYQQRNDVPQHPQVSQQMMAPQYYQEPEQSSTHVTVPQYSQASPQNIEQNSPEKNESIADAAINDLHDILNEIETAPISSISHCSSQTSPNPDSQPPSVYSSQPSSIYSSRSSPVYSTQTSPVIYQTENIPANYQIQNTSINYPTQNNGVRYTNTPVNYPTHQVIYSTNDTPNENSQIRKTPTTLVMNSAQRQLNALAINSCHKQPNPVMRNPTKRPANMVVMNSAKRPPTNTAIVNPAKRPDDRVIVSSGQSVASTFDTNVPQRPPNFQLQNPYQGHLNVFSPVHKCSGALKNGNVSTTNQQSTTKPIITPLRIIKPRAIRVKKEIPTPNSENAQTGSVQIKPLPKTELQFGSSNLVTNWQKREKTFRYAVDRKGQTKINKSIKKNVVGVSLQMQFKESTQRNSKPRINVQTPNSQAVGYATIPVMMPVKRKKVASEQTSPQITLPHHNVDQHTLDGNTLGATVPSEDFDSQFREFFPHFKI